MLSEEWADAAYALSTGSPPADPTTPLALVNMIPLFCLVLVVILPRLRLGHWM